MHYKKTGDNESPVHLLGNTCPFLYPIHQLADLGFSYPVVISAGRPDRGIHSVERHPRHGLSTPFFSTKPLQFSQIMGNVSSGTEESHCVTTGFLCSSRLPQVHAARNASSREENSAPTGKNSSR